MKKSWLYHLIFHLPQTTFSVAPASNTCFLKTSIFLHSSLTYPNVPYLFCKICGTNSNLNLSSLSLTTSLFTILKCYHQNSSSSRHDRATSPFIHGSSVFSYKLKISDLIYFFNCLESFSMVLHCFLRSGCQSKRLPHNITEII